MSVSIEPLTVSHVEPIAELLSERHRQDREFAPRLPADLESSTVMLDLVRDLVEDEGAEGVVGKRNGRVVAYLIGARDYRVPTDAFASLMQPRSVAIPYGGFAMAGGEPREVGRALYAALAEKWVRSGIIRHYATVPAHPESLEFWSDLGFARHVALAARPVKPDIGGRGEIRGLEIRQATSPDEPVIRELMEDIFRAFADPPAFVPFLRETAAAREAFVIEHLADPQSPTWLATIEGRAVGLQMFEEPQSVHWHQEPLTSLPDSVYLHFAGTSPDVRGMGVGAALLRHAMTWATNAGYDVCLLHYLTASRASSFWHNMGFEPYVQWLCRSVDERTVWAHGEQ